MPIKEQGLLSFGVLSMQKNKHENWNALEILRSWHFNSKLFTNRIFWLVKFRTISLGWRLLLIPIIFFFILFFFIYLICFCVGGGLQDYKELISFGIILTPLTVCQAGFLCFKGGLILEIENPIEYIGLTPALEHKRRSIINSINILPLKANSPKSIQA